MLVYVCYTILKSLLSSSDAYRYKTKENSWFHGKFYAEKSYRTQQRQTLDLEQTMFCLLVWDTLF